MRTTPLKHCFRLWFVIPAAALLAVWILLKIEWKSKDTNSQTSQQNMNVDSWWKHPVGTKWVFEADYTSARGPSKRLAEFTVADDQGGKIRFEYDLFNPPDPGATASIDQIWHEQDGYVMWAGDDMEPCWRVLKLGSMEGDVWSGPPGEGSAKHLGIEELTVPAGTFSAAHVRIAGAEDGKTHDFWFNPKEGLLQWNTLSPKGSARFALRAYSRGS